MVSSGGNSTSDGHGCHHTVLGIAHTLDSFKVASCLAVLCGTAFVFEELTHHINHALHNSPYLPMVHKLYQELMIVGIITVGLFFVINDSAAHLSTEVVVTFEFLHATFTCTTVFFVLNSFLLIRFSELIKQRITFASAQDVLALLGLYDKHKQKQTFKHGGLLPLSLARELIQFRIVKIFFQREYSVPASFDFALYLRESLNSYLVRQLDVSPSSFLLVMAVAFLYAGYDHYVGPSADDDHDSSSYYGNSSYSYYSYDNYYGHDDHHDDTPSLTRSGVGGFAFFVWGSLVFDVALYLLVRRCQDLLIKRAGCPDYRSYRTFLANYYEEEVSKSARAEERPSVHLLQERHRVIETKLSFPHSAKHLQAKTRAAVSFVLHKSLASGLIRSSNSRTLDEEDHHTVPIELPPLVVSNQSPKRAHNLGSGSTSGLDGEVDSRISIEEQLEDLERQSEAALSIKFRLDLNAIFPLGSPALLQRMLDLAVLCNCILASLLLTNYGIVAADYDSPWERCGWLALMIVPQLLSLPLRGLCVQTHSLIMAVAFMAPDIMGKVIEHQTQSKRILANLMGFFRGRIREILRTDDLHQGHLAEVFFSLPLDEEKHLPRARFRQFLTELNIHMTAEQFSILFKALDPLNRGVLSFESLYRSVFPGGSKEQAHQTKDKYDREPVRPQVRHSTLRQITGLQSRLKSKRRLTDADEWAAAELVSTRSVVPEDEQEEFDANPELCAMSPSSPITSRVHSFGSYSSFDGGDMDMVQMVPMVPAVPAPAPPSFTTRSRRRTMTDASIDEVGEENVSGAEEQKDDPASQEQITFMLKDRL